jgi:hypothetical protein|tara:strand:+ start:1693 stop:1941 length:249 start_codon:yes stop_codon:yes gene_type:complete
MKKLNTIYHIIIIVTMGYLGIANYLLTEKVIDVQQQATAGMMMGNDANLKIEMFMQLMADDFDNEVRRAVRDILKEDMPPNN